MYNTGKEVLEFDVVPEVGLRNNNVEFVLGMPVNQVIGLIQSNTRLLSNISLSYSRKHPFDRDICIHLKSNGIKLNFDPVTQLLKIIQVDDMKKIILSYKNKRFSEPQSEVTLDNLEQYFSSTQPGAYDDEQKLYVHSWPGLSFYFPNNGPVHVSPGFSPNLSSLQYDGSSAPRVAKMAIYKGLGANKVDDVRMPVSSFCAQNSTVMINVDLKKILKDGLKICFESQASPKAADGVKDIETVVRFGDSVSSVLRSLGAPSKIFYKSEDKMSIHRGEGDKKSCSVDAPHFYFNYFSMGLDVLFSVNTKTVMKIVLHTNLPGHYDFGIYSRCQFNIDTNTDLPSISNKTKFSEISSLFNDVTSSESIKPVVLRRRDEQDPFKPTYLYGTSNFIVEVMDNEYIASVTFFDPLRVD